LVLLGLVMIALTQGAQFVAIGAQPAATTSLVLSVTPLLVAAASAASLGEAPERRQLVGAAAILIGAAVYFGGELGFTAVGMIAAVIGLLANGTAAILGRAVNREARVSALVVTTLSMLAGSVALLGVAVEVEGLPRLDASGWAIVVWLAVVNTALAFTLWNISLRRLSATESAGLNNTMLIQIALLGWWFLGEAPGIAEWIGMLLAAAGVFAIQARRSPPLRSVEATRALAGPPAPVDRGRSGEPALGEDEAHRSRRRRRG